MFIAHTTSSDGSPQSFDSVQAFADAWDPAEHLAWIDLGNPQADQLQVLGELFQLDEESLEDCLVGQQRPRVDEHDSYVFVIMYGLIGADDDEQFTPRKLAIYCGQRYLITVHQERLPTIEELKTRIARNGANTLGRGADYLLFVLIDKIVDKYLYVAQVHEDQLEDIEDKSMTDQAAHVWLDKATELRRQLLGVRRMAFSTRELVVELSGDDCPFVSEAVQDQFGHVIDHLMQVMEVVDGLRELLSSIRENHRAMLADRTNEIMKVLTLTATLLLPISVIASIYGMNLPLWPPQDAPGSFWGVMAVMVGVAVAMLGYFRWRRWL